MNNPVSDTGDYFKEWAFTRRTCGHNHNYLPFDLTRKNPKFVKKFTAWLQTVVKLQEN